MLTDSASPYPSTYRPIYLDDMALRQHSAEAIWYRDDMALRRHGIDTIYT